jgi:hypothetical protein
MTKIPFVGESAFSNAALKRHKDYCRQLGVPRIGGELVSENLAIVGGGYTAAHVVQEIKDFDGEVWAVNGAFDWCKTNGINPTFFAIDPSDEIAEYCHNVDRAIVSDIIHQETFKALEGCHVEYDALGPSWGTSAVSAAPIIAAKRGHKNLTFFGCPMSFIGDTHLYMNEQWSRVWVDCGGKEYVTSPQLIMQVEHLAGIARLAPNFITVVGEGFLPALIEHGDYDVTHTTRDIADTLKAA